MLLATDLHAANVLRAEREPWLVIDPKPFIGDPAFDATQHLFNCRARLHADPAAQSVVSPTCSGSIMSAFVYGLLPALQPTRGISGTTTLSNSPGR